MKILAIEKEIDGVGWDNTEKLLSNLPLVKSGKIKFEIMELKPYTLRYHRRTSRS
jgi:hypothetical protein